MRCIFSQYIVLLISFYFTLPAVVMCQQFKATAIVGINASQIDGDSLVGYNKAGLHVGARLSYNNNNAIDLAIEMLYSQRGSSKNFFKNNSKDVIVANFIEIPIVFTVRDWFITDKNYYKVRAETGISYGYLIGAESEKYNTLKFNKHDVSWFLGGGLRFTPFWGLSFRYTTSLNNMYQDPELNISRFKSYFFTFRSEFYF